MYLEHFGLAVAPFRITPDIDFFFSGANRGATLDALLYAILNDEGIVKVSGEVGSGKTMLCRVLMERLPAHVSVIYLANPSLSRDDILFAIAAELALTVPDHARSVTVMRALQERLIALYGEGRQVVVLIDEAHAMPIESLEEIRLLSNLESNRHKLLQLVLFGQPELNGVLARTDMRQLKDRITHNFVLEPLVCGDIARYVDFRMRAAGYHGPEIFSPRAVKAIAAASGGLTRRINILADKALLAAFAGNVHQVTAKQVRAAVRDSDFSRVPVAGRRRLALMASLLLPALAAAAFAGWRYSANDTSAPPQAATPLPAPIAATAAAPAPPLPPAADEGDADLGPRTRRLVAQTRQWLAATADDQWFIQLLATDRQRADMVETFIGGIAPILDAGQLRAYTAKLGDARRIGVIYGQYADRRAAEKAIEGLPAELRAHQPYPRQVKRLR